MTKIVIALWAALLVTPTFFIETKAATALEIKKETPQVFIESLFGFWSEFSKNTPKSKQNDVLKTLMDEHFDMESIAKYALGPLAKGEPMEKLQKFQKLFSEMMFTFYKDQLLDLVIESFVISNHAEPFPGEYNITSRVKQAGAVGDVEVVWVVAKTPKGLAVIDLIISSVSLSTVQRNKISRLYMEHGGTLDGLLENMNTPSTNTPKLKTSAPVH